VSDVIRAASDGEELGLEARPQRAKPDHFECRRYLAPTPADRQAMFTLERTDELRFFGLEPRFSQLRPRRQLFEPSVPTSKQHRVVTAGEPPSVWRELRRHAGVRNEFHRHAIDSISSVRFLP
jgi:hypothetical protein